MIGPFRPADRTLQPLKGFAMAPEQAGGIPLVRMVAYTEKWNVLAPRSGSGGWGLGFRSIDLNPHL